MIKKLIKITMWFMIILGTIMLAINFVYGAEITYLSRQTINAEQNLYYYKLDIHSYLINLQRSLNINFTSWLPNRPTQPEKTNTDTLSLGFTLLIKYVIYVINWISFLGQFLLLTPIKIILYALTVLFAIFGLNTTQVGIVIQAIYNFQPPYIPVNF